MRIFPGLLFICTWVITIRLSVFSDLREGGVYRLDGYNVFTVPDDGNWYNGNMSIVSGDPDDVFYHDPLRDNTTGSILDGSVMIGAETGDPLLNRYTSAKNYANRDHRTLLVLSHRNRKLPLKGVFRYRYLDTYSDRFDSLWKNYREITGKPMDFNDEGLSSEVYSAVAGKFADLEATVSYNWFSRWHATPYFFSPLYSKGFSVNPKLRLEKQQLTLFSSVRYTPSVWYYDHHTAVSYHDVNVTGCAEIPLNERVHAEFSLEYDNTLSPSSYLRGGMSYRDSTVVTGIYGRWYSDSHLGFDFFSTVKPHKLMSCSLAVEKRYLQRSRSYSFMQNDSQVFYNPSSLEQLVVTSAVTVSAGAVLPLQVSGWISYCDNPLWEQVSFFGDTVHISQIVYGRKNHFYAGIFGKYRIDFNRSHMAVRSGMSVPSGGRDFTRFSGGTRASLSVYWSTGGENPATISTAISCNNGSVLNYPVSRWKGDTSMVSFSAPPSNAINLSCRFPFVFPFFRKIIGATAFVADAGPIRMSKHQRVQEHPEGNLIGPEVFAGFECSLR